MKKPNIVVFCTDQQPARWLGCAGNEHIRTPNIDKLAKDGVLFNNAFCNTPICMASRSTMFTGLPSSEHGVRTNGINLDDSYPALPQILKDNGYKTFATGKLHLTSWQIGQFHSPELTEIDPKKFPESSAVWDDGRVKKVEDGYFGLDSIDLVGQHGWNVHGDYTNWMKENHPEALEKLQTRESSKPTLNETKDKLASYFSTVPKELFYNAWIKERAIARIDELEGDDPFFAWVSFPDPHWPFGPTAPYNEMYHPDAIDKPLAWDDDKAKMPDFYHKSYYDERGIGSVDGGDTDKSIEQIMEIKALAYGSTSSIDDNVGEVIEHLKKKGLYEDTVFLFISDHGEACGDHRMFNKGPFHYDSILNIPFIVAYPKKLKAGATSPALVSLLDFMPTVLDLAGVEYPANETPDWQGFFAEKYPMYAGKKRLPGNSLVPILTGEKEEIQDWVLVEDDDDIRGICVRTLIAHDYKLTIFMNREDGILFDRVKDPEERNNLFDDPSYADAKVKMMGRMNQALLNNQERIKRRISIA
jgi:arylsulfatase A-like enzyme